MRRNRSSVACSLVDLVQAVDHGAEDRGVGAQELRILVAEVARLAAVHLQQAVGPPAWQEDRHVRQRDHAGILQERRHLEAALLADVAGDDGLADPDRVGLGGPLVHLQAQVPDDAGIPADARPHEERPAVVHDLENLGAHRPERCAHQATGVRQDLVERLSLRSASRRNRRAPAAADHLHAVRHAGHRHPASAHRPAIVVPGLRAGAGAASRRRAEASVRGDWR